MSDDESNWINEVLSFWFETLTPQSWFVRDEAVDNEIIKRFSDLYEQLSQSLPEICKTSAKAALAAIIVLDQFPRNIFRDHPKSFATDETALAIAEQAIRNGLDKELNNFERQFLYMPYQHSEDASVQARSIELYATLNNPQTLDFAQRHKDIIDRFGRYPHRNAILGRESTPEELAFLKEPGSSF